MKSLVIFSNKEAFLKEKEIIFNQKRLMSMPFGLNHSFSNYRIELGLEFDLGLSSLIKDKKEYVKSRLKENNISGIDDKTVDKIANKIKSPKFRSVMFKFTWNIFKKAF